MEAWGIIMTAFTLFGMLVLVIASVTTDDRTSAMASTQAPMEPASAASKLKEAA